MTQLRQGFSWWCFANRGIEPSALLAGAARIGYQAVDLVEEELWPLVKDHDLSLGAIGGHQSLTDGMNRRENAPRIEAELRGSLEKAATWEIPVLVCFTGNRSGLDDHTGRAHCAEILSRLAPEAEKLGVTWPSSFSTAVWIIQTIREIEPLGVFSSVKTSTPPP